MTKIPLVYIICYCLLVNFACQNSAPKLELTADEYNQILKEVESAVWAFHKADTSMNANQVIDLIWPECTMLIDGHRYSNVLSH